jgi:hypothetical protein
VQKRIISHCYSLPEQLYSINFEQSMAEIMRKTRKFLLKNYFCVLNQFQGEMNGVLNSANEDSCIYFSYSIMSCRGCELRVSHPHHQNDIISQLFQFLL